MKKSLLPFLVCPVSRKPLEIYILEEHGQDIQRAVFLSPDGFMYPVIGGLPRFLPEAFLDYEKEMQSLLPDFSRRKATLLQKFGGLIEDCVKKNRRTKASFTFEWGLLDHKSDKIWHENRGEMVQTFYRETGFQPEDIKGKMVLDAGCGHGVLSHLIWEEGAATVIGMDLGPGVEKAMQLYGAEDVHFIQADVLFPPLAAARFDLVHSSGVIHHMPSTELAFSRLAPLSAIGGRFCVWLYHPIPSPVHSLFRKIRPLSCRLPIGLQYWLYRIFILPPALLWHRTKGKKINATEMMIDLMDALSCEFRQEHLPEETIAWYWQQGFENWQLSTRNHFGFSVFADRKAENDKLNP
jgi:SAM-dependent methyltransferase/uncharacterized protein YbaR (Trm112 family)